MEKAVLISNELFDLSSEQNLLTIEFHKNQIDLERDKDFFDDAFFKLCAFDF